MRDFLSRSQRTQEGFARRQGTHSVTDGTQNRHRGDAKMTLCEDRDTHYGHIRWHWGNREDTQWGFHISLFTLLVTEALHWYFLDVNNTLLFWIVWDLWTNAMSYLFTSFTDGNVFTSNVNWSHFKGTWHNLQKGVILETKSWLHLLKAWLLRWLGFLHNHALHRSDQMTIWTVEFCAKA